ncbi:NACHT domain-containing protein [Streptomyces sp. MUM 178J]|uniref:NACHT domain-containing protein n=1 Tax=Streptomyces sp. MUM 178J TaxID=2791991 RepID=UPI001F042356|nr:NACHT domain-containing protein [Streptomyces sp. MUM 178J]WRQ82101.1 NACHT domain-containing protein [Streptomyces sp. MUM 178J]
MEYAVSRRVVAVLGERQGTGVLLGPRLVLTSAHLLGEQQVRASVAHPGHSGAIRCTVLWTGSPQSCDAALLAADRPVVPDLPRLRWGRLTKDAPLPHCQTIGFPGCQRYGDDGRLDLGQYTGTVLPAMGRLRGALTLWLDHSPGSVRRDESPLAGLSGSPVFAGAVLIGLVSETAADEGQQQLRTVSVEAVKAAWRRPDSKGAVSAVPASIRNRLPALERVSGFDPEDAPFENRYAAGLRAQYRRTEIFGIDELGVQESGWDLDTAYLSLEATDAEPAADRPWDRAHRPQRVEDLLGARPRTLLRGEAGAGKTTLVWWLASHAACGTLPRKLDALNGLVPFVIPMRTVHADQDRFPAPDQLHRAAELPVGPAPDGWAERVLEAGRALILVDGLDELPQEDRPKARAWLTRLLALYRDNRCLATVRPGAVERHWLTSEGFSEVLLLPMSDQDIGAFVASWHAAARGEYAALGDRHRAAAAQRRLHALEKSLLTEFRRSHALRDLARTPLLCAVICALHRKREGDLPDTRWQLYHAGLDMLLGNRDKRRGVRAVEGVTIGVEQHKLLLQHIAVWLVRGGQTQLTRAQAVHQIRQAVRGMPQVARQGTPERILSHLLNRSGLLQERSQGVLQFIHRTFQDYLAAKELAETDSVEELLRRAGDEQWQDVIRLSTGHLDRRRAGLLIERLGGLGDTSEDAGQRRALYLLAAHCAAAAIYLDDRTRTATEDRIRALMPPKDIRDVVDLIALGPCVLPLLPGPSDAASEDIAPDHLRNVIQIIAQVGDDETGLERLTEFIGHPDRGVRAELARAWSRFPPAAYARQVLSRLRMDDFTVEVSTAGQLAALRYCTPTPRLNVRGHCTPDALDAYLPRSGVKSLSVYRNRELTTLGFLADRPSVTAVTLAFCTGLSTFADIADRSFDVLTVDSGTLAVPGPYPRVGTLRVTGHDPIRTADLLRWGSIEHLIADTPEHVPSLVNAAGAIHGLRRLWINYIWGSFDWDSADRCPRISELRLSGVDFPVDTAALARMFPSLLHLQLKIGKVSGQELDLTPLRGIPGLSVEIRHSAQTRLHLTGADALEVPITVHTTQGDT